MSLVIAGRIVPLTRETSVAPKESSSFKGKVWIGDEGRIAAITQGAEKGPNGLACSDADLRRGRHRRLPRRG